MEPLILEHRTEYSGYLTLERLRIRLKDGAEVWREIERHGDAAAVLPYDTDRRCALIAQLFHAPVFDVSGATSLQEACAGMIANEQAAAAARREALKELGVTLHRLRLRRSHLEQPRRLHRTGITVPRTLRKCGPGR